MAFSGRVRTLPGGAAWQLALRLPEGLTGGLEGPEGWVRASLGAVACISSGGKEGK